MIKNISHQPQGNDDSLMMITTTTKILIYKRIYHAIWYETANTTIKCCTRSTSSCAIGGKELPKNQRTERKHCNPKMMYKSYMVGAWVCVSFHSVKDVQTSIRPIFRIRLSAFKRNERRSRHLGRRGAERNVTHVPAQREFSTSLAKQTKLSSNSNWTEQKQKWIKKIISAFFNIICGLSIDQSMSDIQLVRHLFYEKNFFIKIYYAMPWAILGLWTLCV